VTCGLQTYFAKGQEQGSCLVPMEEEKGYLHCPHFLCLTLTGP
jgi:hypothetical protein